MVKNNELNRLYEHAFNYEADRADVMSFSDYRELCDAVDGFRKIGIQDEESYESIIQDERTVFLEKPQYRVPLLAPIEYEKMYEEERCIAMTGKRNIMLLAVPFEQLKNEPQVTYAIDDDTAVIVEEFVSTENPANISEHDVSNLPFVDVKAIDFRNPDLARYPGHETSWMAAYRFDMVPRGNKPKEYMDGILAVEILEAWSDICAEAGRPSTPDETSTGAFILSTEDLIHRPDIVDQLWEISQFGFGKVLGAHHPVAMEFNKQFFDKQIVAANTATGVYCVDGEVMCFGFLGLDMKNNEWLNENSSIMQKELKEAEAADKPLVHFHELIGKGRKGMGYSTHILNAFFEATAKTGYAYSVFFESTNLSSTYIPPLIERNLSRSDEMEISSDINMIGKLSYWALVSDRRTDNLGSSEQA
jgi:hypothetical protein